MLISRECYRDIYLEGKDEATIRDEVSRLREEMNRLKRIMESPSYPYETHPFPSEGDMLEACRKYLDEAYDALKSMGKAPEYTEEELAAGVADGNLSLVRKLSLAIGVYLDKCYELKLYDKDAILVRTANGVPSVEISLPKAQVMDALAELHLGEWRESYLAEQYGSSFSEPTRWRLLVEYSDGIAPRFYEGVGVFPYNFSALKKLLGAED